MTALDKVKNQLSPGAVYRRSDLLQWSNAVDRHLEQLQNEDVLRKISGGLYYCPKTTAFGKTFPPDRVLVEAFLNDSRFLMFSPSAYNSLGLGTTQLYNDTIVYNHKRHGVFRLGNRAYHFIRKHHFPKKLSDEFLLVDLVNNVSRIAEDKGQVLELVVGKSKTMDQDKLNHAIIEFGGVRARNFFALHLKTGALNRGH